VQQQPAIKVTFRTGWKTGVVYCQNSRKLADLKVAWQ